MMPAKPVKQAPIRREDIREQALLLVKRGPKPASELAQEIGAEPSFVAIALSTDGRFARYVVAGVMHWGLTAAKPRATAAIALARISPVQAKAVRAVVGGTPIVVIEEIGPERAAELLELSRGNRKVRVGHVEWLARQIVDGCWRVTPQCIAISSTNRLLDGHHRLHAIVQAGKPVIAAVSYGWEDDTWDSLDCGIVRLPQDRLVLIADSVKWNTHAVEMIHSILRLERNLRGKATNEQLLGSWKAYRHGIELVREIFPKPIGRLTRTPLFGALVRYHEQASGKAIAFARLLLDDHPPAMPSQQLRSWLLSGHFVGCGYRGNSEVYWRSVAAMCAHRDDRPMAELHRATSWAGADVVEDLARPRA